MAYIKSFFVGVLAVLMAIIAMVVIVIVTLTLKGRNLPPNESIQWDPISLVRGSPIIWTILIMAFVIGFAWEYRRALSS